MTEELLKVEHVTMQFGGLKAISDVSFEAKSRNITAVIGPNGAGKTTLFNCITGFYKPTIGRLTLNVNGQKRLLEQMDGHMIARAGVARTFQNIRLFPKMTVLENLIVAQHNALMKASVFSLAGILGLPIYRKAEAEAVEFARHWLRKVNIEAKADWEAGSLPYGDQRRLEIARAMCIRPKLLCLDEPAAGLNPAESNELARILREIRDEEGIGILLIEHDMSVVMNISDHVVVLDHGVMIARGSPEVVKANPAVIKAYLGEEDEQELGAA